jgi:hypothetical protein
MRVFLMGWVVGTQMSSEVNEYALQTTKEANVKLTEANATLMEAFERMRRTLEACQADQGH